MLYYWYLSTIMEYENILYGIIVLHRLFTRIPSNIKYHIKAHGVLFKQISTIHEILNGTNKYYKKKRSHRGRRIFKSPRSSLLRLLPPRLFRHICSEFIRAFRNVLSHQLILQLSFANIFQFGSAS